MLKSGSIRYLAWIKNKSYAKVEAKILSILLLVALLPGFTSCKDDLLYDPTEIREGESVVDATVFFKAADAASLGSSRAAGNAIKNIENLCVLIYNQDGTQARKYYYGDGTNDFTSISIKQDGNTDRPADGETSAESVTPRATLRFPVDNGFYRIYAVANMGDISAEIWAQTESGLKNHKLTWRNEDKDANGKYSVASNNQMFGYFNTDGSANGFDASTVKLNGRVSLFCWLRRAASKVTVAFDATRLNDGIRIHFKSVRIKHIPRECYLGRNNAPGYQDSTFLKKIDGATVANTLFEDGEIYYYSGKADDSDGNFASWPYVSKGLPKYGLSADGSQPQTGVDNADISAFHTESTPALYFYENLQGNEKTKTGIKDKRQDYDGDGVLDAPGLPDDPTKYPDYKPKDNVEFGTYIEVEAYYDARMSQHPSEGKIIYRFMLGKDVEKDYDAERNFHYKLTLVFNGNANDVDWHIEYREDKELIAPTPYYISYLYNQSANIPIRIKGNPNNAAMLIRVIENHWWPTIEDKDDPYKFADSTKVYTNNAGWRKDVWHGFVSLKKIDDKIIGDKQHYKNDKDWAEGQWNTNEYGKTTITDLTLTNPDVRPADGGGYDVSVPFYTLPKQIIPTSGYTGNNPYVAYSREAKLEVKLVEKGSDGKPTTTPILDSKGKPLIDTISIIQVRRCVNPKGVWRKWDNDKSFHVVMKILPRDDAKKFETYRSKGGWRASVERDPDGLVTLDGKNVVGNYVQGTIDSPMDFTIKFNGKCTDSTQVRYAIVLVEYNNYTCHHRIFVRQGYAPTTLNDNSLKWHTCNLYSSDHETESPLEGGSLFKYGNLDQAILAENDKTYGFQVPVGNNTLKLAGDKSAKWSDITNTSKDEGSTGFKRTDGITIKNVKGATKDTKVRVANIDDYTSLRNGANREFGYGVLYGDGATETLEKIEEVYGYYRGGDQSYGMRGCFVYNTQNAKNLFFPIGASGYGRRRTDKSWYASGVTGLEGSLQYAWRSKRYSTYDTELDGSQATLWYRPLFENIYMRPGATYWFESFRKQIDGQGKYTIGTAGVYLDVNYFTFDFSQGANEPLEGTGTSACMIRCVEDVK